MQSCVLVLLVRPAKRNNFADRQREERLQPAGLNPRPSFFHSLISFTELFVLRDRPALHSSRRRRALPPMATDVFNSKNLAVQAQKKILGKMVSKSIATTLIDDTSSEVLDELYRVTKEYTQNKKEAERVIKNLIKTVIKLAVLHRNNQFNQDELALMEKFKKKVHQLAMTVVSFHQVEYTFDRNVLSRLLNECRELLHEIIQRHLTAKSHGRVNNVFDHFSDCDFLAALYNPFGKFKPHLQKLCDGINKMLDEENI